jgi:vitamin B12 transporter
MRKIIYLVAALFTIPLSAQDTTKTTLLREVIFSASRVEETLLDVPRSASVIQRDVIEKSNYNSVGELLSSQEGIYVVGSNQNPGANQNLFLRGANSNQVVVMIDGKRINDPSAPNAAIDLSELSLTNIERIEIIRGSHTTTYGGAAIGGVINIITRRNSAEGLIGNVSLQAGTFGSGSSTFTEQLDATYSLKSGVYFNGALWQQNVHGLDATVKNTNAGFSTNDKDDFRKTDAAVKAGYRHGVWDAYIGFKRTDQKADIDNGAFADDDNNYVSFNRNLVDYLVKYSINDAWSVSALGAYTDSERLNENDSSVVDDNGATDRSYFKGIYHGRILTNELQLNQTSEKISTVLGGGVYHEKMFFDTYFFSAAFGFPYESVTDYDSIDTSTRTLYLFGKVTYDWNDFSIALGGRFSNHSEFGNYFTYEFNPSYKLRKGLVYASLSTGYNAPSLYQLYDPSKGFNAYTSRGNRNLEAEESISIEAGVKHDFTTGSYITLSAFRTVVKNSIEYIYLWDGGTPLTELDYTHYAGDTYVNSASQFVNGMEVSGKVSFSPKLSLVGNISVLDAKIRISESDIDSEQTGDNHIQLYNYGVFLTGRVEKDDLVRRPNVLVNEQLVYAPSDVLTISAGYRLAGSRYDAGYDATLGPFGALARNKVKNYNLFDLSANYKITQRIAVSGKIENLLDEKYSEIEGYRTRGRSLYLKILYKLR